MVARVRLVSSWIAIVAAAATVSSGCSGKSAPKDRGADAASRPSAFALEEASIPALQEKMASGELTSRQIVDQYIARIEKLNPTLHAVIELNPDARSIADELDAERKAGHVRGPLHGIPILLKDNIATADRTETAAGSLALVGAKPRQDSAVAKRLRDAGAVLLGKANLSEWANFRSDPVSSGWSGRGGQTRNPYALDRSPWGSSSGSAVAVSANLVAVAIGTETDGSIVCPASVNGVVGIKPTLGLVSAAGIIPIAHSYDTAGPMARTVTDAAIVLTALGEGEGIDYRQALDVKALEGARVGVWWSKGMKEHPWVRSIMTAALESMRAQGAVIVDPIEIDVSKELVEAEFEVMLYEFKAGLAEYLSAVDGDGPKTLADVVAFDEQHAAEEMPDFGQEVFALAQAKAGLDDPAYLAARETAHRLATEGIDKVIAQQRLDAIVAPTVWPATPIDRVNGDARAAATSTPAAVAGYPSITVPAGFARGLPVGISFFGPAHSEQRLLGIAFSFEQATRVRKPPELRPTVRDE